MAPHILVFHIFKDQSPSLLLHVETCPPQLVFVLKHDGLTHLQGDHASYLWAFWLLRAQLRSCAMSAFLQEQHARDPCFHEPPPNFHSHSPHGHPIYVHHAPQAIPCHAHDPQTPQLPLAGPTLAAIQPARKQLHVALSKVAVHS
jgi:hypothetical protein